MTMTAFASTWQWLNDVKIFKFLILSLIIGIDLHDKQFVGNNQREISDNISTMEFLH